MKVNDYVRTKDGVIAKITDIIEDYAVDCDRNVFDLRDACDVNQLGLMEIPWDFKDKYIIKSGPNPIDVIEAEDYVNGYKVLEICEGNFESNNPHNVKALKLEFIEQNINPNIPFFKRYIFILNENIKSIVTKEQFESIQYKIK